MLKKLLLHVCCAPCACWPIELLKQQYDLTAFFFNPNIQPESEYQARFNELKKYLSKLNVPLVEGPYEVDRWLKLCEPYKDEPERGKRCDVCYQLRLEKTAQYAKEHDFDFFASDLSISPHKKADKINELGQKLAQQYQVGYLESNFKKQEGFKQACQIAKVENFYRQNYCGCTYSKNQKTNTKKQISTK